MSGSHEHAISMEGQNEKKALDQTINGILEANKRIAPDYERVKKSMAEVKNSMKDAKSAHDRAKKKPKIQRVPVVLKERKKFEKHYELPWIEQKKIEKFYEPRWISIGPIHHGTSRLMLAEEKYKPKLVAKFIINCNWKIEALYDKIKGRIKDLKECFEEDVIKEYDDDFLSWMLFFDGCSTLQFISSYAQGHELLEDFSIKTDQVAYAQQDLFLLENQIPFLVLKLLMECHKDAQELKNSVKMFIRYNVMTPEKYKKMLAIDIDTDSEPTHLLELLWLAMLEQPKKHHTNCAGKMLSFPLNKAITLFRFNRFKGRHSPLSSPVIIIFFFLNNHLFTYKF